MSKRKTGAKKKRTRRADKAYTDAEEIAARLKIGSPPSIGLSIEGRSGREQWIRKNAELDLSLAMHGNAAPSALSHLLDACLRIRGLNDTDDPRRESALSERDEILKLLDAAAEKHTLSHLERRAMILAREIDQARAEWPKGPRAFVQALLGEVPTAESARAEADHGHGSGGDWLSRQAARVWAYVKDQPALPTYDAIAGELQMGRKTIADALKELRRRGLIPENRSERK